LGNKTSRDLGSIYTPPDIARFLTSWAVQSPNDKVLDVGVGEGAFVFSAYHRLIELGATVTSAQHQLYGSEIDRFAYNRFLELAEDLKVNFPNVYEGNFFDIDLPLVDVVVGNPPYVRRTYIGNVDQIRQRVMAKNHMIDELYLPRLTDLSVYFLLYALAALKPGGRLAVITSDSWLNVNYGQGLRKYLSQNFEIECLVSLDRRVFDEAQVKPVLVLAIRKEMLDPNRYVHFIRLKNGLPIGALQQPFSKGDLEITDVARLKVKSSSLNANGPWGIYFKVPEVYEELAAHAFMIPLANLAQTRIGVQTLAKEFFVLTPEQASRAQVEGKYLEPLAQSLRYLSGPTIELDTQPGFYIFYSSKSKRDLQGTHALEYILRGESAEVQVRGKGTTVIGYHNKERIKRSSRDPWYDLKTSLERRGRASILIPRLIYRNYTVVWNKAGFVPGELFIEFLPLPLTRVDLEVYLAVLTSSVTEIMLRAHAQVYGGGTYNINPGQIKKVPILNVNLLTARQKEGLRQAYLMYLANKNHDRSAIDAVIYKILGFDKAKQEKLEDALRDLHQIATDSKKSGLGNP
jgi:adenine-specific DNA-methyltransferase